MNDKKVETGRGRRTPLKEQRKHVAAFERSGVTQVEFCRRRSLNPKTFARWLKRWRNEQRPVTPAFAEVALPPAPGLDVELVLAGGMRIRCKTDLSGVCELARRLADVGAGSC